MTVKRPVNDKQDRDNSVSDLQKSKKELFSLIEEKKSSDTDQESIGSSDETESPRSVAKIGRWTPKKIVYVHSQVLRIREEDSHVGDGIGECLSARDKLCGHNQQPRMDFVVFSRPILPASPLSGKAVH